MRFDSFTRAQITDDVTLSFDPTGSTVEIQVDDDWHAAEWQGDAVEADGKWTQSALTTDYFAGPDVTDPGSATVLDTGRHFTQTRVTSGSTIITDDSTPIDVK